MSIVSCCVLLLFIASASVAETLQISDFSAASLEGWETKKFTSLTSYQLSKVEEKQVLLAESQNSASALIRKVQIDIEKYPFLNWTWRIENRLVTENEKNKSGDDYAVRLYVVIDGGIFIWKTKAVNYVWANQSSKGEVWENAFAGKNAMMIALRNRQDKLSTWYTEKRNIHEDLKRLFGTDFHFIDAIAIMTDTDNSHGQAKAYYGDIYFSKE
ncbi:MAG: DUF3047 domain-containing protein [Candidatus Electrothrix communis]|nr:MAG: DUF3047 domain-containing protein [Candidatus Electrothrix communis]